MESAEGYKVLRVEISSDNPLPRVTHPRLANANAANLITFYTAFRTTNKTLSIVLIALAARQLHGPNCGHDDKMIESRLNVALR